MNQAGPERPEGEPRPRAVGIVPRALAEASPTWELELLLSGAVLVALFQVSGVIDRAFERFAPHATRALSFPILFAYLYGKAMVLALIATFVLHLASRGYWVGLVGLNSVFPNGVRWDQLKYGPITRAVIRERLPSLPPIIARLDNFCSALFSFGFLLVLTFGVSLLLVGVVGGIAYAIALIAFGGRRALTIFYVVLAVLAGVPGIAALIDRRLGARLDPSGPRARMLRRAAHVYYWSMGLPLYGPIMLTLVSNTRRRLFMAILYAAMIGILVFVAVRLVAAAGGLGMNNYAYFAQPDRLSVNASYYESQRRAGEALPRTPTIQSDVIREPFVKLFIPYAPERHNRALAAACPAVRPLQPLGVRFGDGAPVPDSAAAAVLRCFAQLHPVTLNGAPLADLEFRFYVHPRNSLRGVIAYIPTSGLPRGRNVLTVQRAPRVARGRRPVPPLTPYVIPFWL